MAHLYWGNVYYLKNGAAASEYFGKQKEKV